MVSNQFKSDQACTPGRDLYVTAETKADPVGFTINLMASSDVALHVNARYPLHAAGSHIGVKTLLEDHSGIISVR